MKVQGKIIIVTGGADGIGAALCRRFAREGAAHIAVVDLNAEGAAKVAAEIGGSSYGVDVSNPSAVDAMVRAVEASHGRIDLFCQNAGVGGGEPDPDNAASAPDAVWNRAWGVMCGRPPRRKGEVDVRRSVECSHVFGLLLQRSRLLALMKSADRLPNHVNALEAL